MPEHTKLEPKNFYESLPSVNHRTGDIWRDLPAFGLLNRSFVDAIVITPACDLANRKCETITYLPIVPVTTYLASPAYRFECWQEAQAALSKLKALDKVTPPHRFELPLIEELDGILSSLTDTQRGTAAGQQLASYVEYVKKSSEGEEVSISLLAQSLSSKRLDEVVSRIVTNALKSDIHFLPHDGLNAEFSAVRAHSVALFRYPTTVPIEILDSAQRSFEEAWPAVKRSLITRIPIANSFERWPVKMTTLKNEFVSDLLSRYVSTYIRIGSKDFSASTIDEITSNIRGV
jgi:hypothetical protein